MGATPAAVDAPRGVVAPLQRWAETSLRDLPWRHTRDPWHILVSEVMLQQTQVARVVERYPVFLERFPTPRACASAPAAEVIECWAGLGYNRRALNLWRAAGVVAEHHDGRLPRELPALLALPGVGPYTARAILVFAFEQPIGVVDTNVGRLLSRWTGRSLTTRQAQQVADDLVPARGAWSWNQSLFDFAVEVCTKRDPSCDGCPVRASCAWQGSGPDPAVASAGVSGRQSRFEGSDRQVRGRIVDRLRTGPLDVADLAGLGRPTDSAADLERIVAGLITDGLVERLGRSLRLPTSPSPGVAPG